MNNTSDAERPALSQCPPARLSTSVWWFQTCTYFVIVLAAVVGNAMVIRVVFAHRRMLTPTNYLIVNIAVSDLVMVFLAMLPTLVSMMRNTRKWIDGLVGEILCKIFAYTPNVSISCSIFSMTVLAFERYRMTVVFPMKRLVSRSKTKKLIFAVWVASLLTNSPLLYASKVVQYNGAPYCSEDWAPLFDPVRAPAMFTMSAFVLQYALPILVISPLYVIIVVKFWNREIPGNTTRANACLAHSRKNVLKMLVATVAAFAACWLLSHVNSFLLYCSDAFHPCGLPWGLHLAGFLSGHSNTAINCCIYATFSNDYRRGFRTILRPLFRRKVTPLPGHQLEAQSG